jgi:hypothetical protein
MSPGPGQPVVRQLCARALKWKAGLVAGCGAVARVASDWLELTRAVAASTGPRRSQARNPCSCIEENAYVPPSPLPARPQVGIEVFDFIVSRNALATGTAAQANDIAGTVATVSSFNLIGTGGSGGLVNGTGGNQVGAAKPGLRLLASNGGHTQTIALATGSPAIGEGSSTIPGIVIPNTDQRGVARPANCIDIGAYQTATVIPLAGLDSCASQLYRRCRRRCGIPVATTVSTSPGSTLADRGSIRLATLSPNVRSSGRFRGRRLGVRRRQSSGAPVHKAAPQTQSPRPAPHTAAPAGRAALIRTSGRR